MNFRLELICVKEDGTEERREVLTFTKEQLVLETLGLTVVEGKKLLAKVQAGAVAQQTSAYLEQHRHCAACGRKHRSKGQGRSTVQTLFGPVSVPNPRWQRCACQGNNSQTIRPTAQWLTSHSSPELLYVETKWASLLPYAKVADLRKDVLPVAPTWSQETVCKHLHATAQRMEQALGEERNGLLTETEEDEGEQPLPDGPMTLGIDGGFIRACHKAGFFEVIAGKSIVACIGS